MTENKAAAALRRAADAWAPNPDSVPSEVVRGWLRGRADAIDLYGPWCTGHGRECPPDCDAISLEDSE